MQKRAQITVFIIVGIVIIIAVGFLVFLRQAPEEEEVPPSMAHIKIFVEQCVRNVGENSLLNLGLNGGYLYFDIVDALPTYYGKTAYWYVAGYNFAPKNKIVEEQLNRYMEDNLNSGCLNDFEELNSPITFDEIKTDTKILPDKVIFNIDFPVTLVDKEDKMTISKFSREIDVRLGRILDVGRKIVDMEMDDPVNISLTYLSELELPVGIHPYSDYALFYSVTDDKSVIGGEAYRLVFANKIGKDVELSNRNPEFVYVGYGVGVPGDRIETFVEVIDDDEVTLSAETDMFVIQQNGSISFTATQADLGEHEITIIAEDGKGGYSEETIYIDVYAEEDWEGIG